MTGLNARAWALWVVAASLPALISRNPLYLALALLAVAVVRARLDRESTAELPVWRLGLATIALASLWNALTAHYGETVLLTLPASLPLVGGRLTLEALVFGATNGLAIWLFFAAFSTFSLAVTPYQMLTLAPRALRHAGLVVSIALTFFPQALRSAREVREAQAVRGHRPRRLRDLPAAVVPLLLNSLENAAQLAEAMEARGFGSTVTRPPAQGLAWLGLIAGSLIQMYWRDTIAGWLIVGLSAGWLAASGRGARVTRYRRDRWTAIDVSIAAASAASIAALILVAVSNPPALVFYPYPRLAWPPIDAPVVLALIALAAPAVRLPAWQPAARASLPKA